MHGMGADRQPAHTLGIVAKLVDVEAVQALLEARDLARHRHRAVRLAVDNLDMTLNDMCCISELFYTFIQFIMFVDSGWR